MEKWIGSKKQVVYPISMRYVFKKHLPNLEIWPKYSTFSFSFWLRNKVPTTKTQNAEKDISDLWLCIEKKLLGFQM